MLRQFSAQQKYRAGVLASCLVFLVFAEVFAARQVNDATAAVDFRSFYAAGYIARTHPWRLYDLTEQARVQSMLTPDHRLFLPYFHPAFEALLYAPFSLLSYRASYCAFMAFNGVLLACILAVLPGAEALRLPVLRKVPGLVLFLFIPVLIALLQGQDSILFLLLACLVWRFQQGGHHRLMGVVLALMLFRFQLVLPFAALLLVRRKYAFLPGFLAGSVLVAAVSIALSGMDGSRLFLRLLASGSLLRDSGPAVQRAMAIHPLAMPNLFGLLHAAGTTRLHAPWPSLMVALFSALPFALAAYLCRKLKRDDHAFAVAIVCSILLSYHLYIHDLSLLVLALVLLRTRAVFYLSGLLYVAIFVLAFYFGVSRFYLLAVPEMLLLLAALLQARKEAGSGVRPVGLASSMAHARCQQS